MTAKRNLLATAPGDPYLVALEITHPDLSVPIRVVADTQNIVIEGHEFIACAFKLTKPDDVDQQLPHAELSVDNIGRELTQWLEYSNGGKGAMCRIIGGTRIGGANQQLVTDRSITTSTTDTYGDLFPVQPGEWLHLHGRVDATSSAFPARLGAYYSSNDQFGGLYTFAVVGGVAAGQSGELDGYLAVPPGATHAMQFLQLQTPTWNEPGSTAVWTELSMELIGALDVDDDITLAMSDMAITPLVVSANLGMQKSLGQPAVAVRYDPTTAIGIFD